MKFALFIDNLYPKIVFVFSILSVIFFAISIYLYTKLPAIIPIHFDINFKADNWGGKANIFILGVIPALLCTIFSKKLIFTKEPLLSIRVLIEVFVMFVLLLLTIASLIVFGIYFKMI